MIKKQIIFLSNFIQCDGWACFREQIKLKRSSKVARHVRISSSIFKSFSLFGLDFCQWWKSKLTEPRRCKWQKNFYCFQTDCRIQIFDREPKIIQVFLRKCWKRTRIVSQINELFLFCSCQICSVTDYKWVDQPFIFVNWKQRKVVLRFWSSFE